MPIRAKTLTLHFVDEHGAEIPDATYTIREQLSHDGTMEYLTAAAKFEIDPEEGTVSPGKVDLDLKAITSSLLRHGLLAITGVEREDGSLLAVGDFGEFDEFYVGQVVRELQRRNVGQGTSPNAGKPSGSSLGASSTTSAQTSSGKPADSLSASGSRG